MWLWSGYSIRLWSGYSMCMLSFCSFINLSFKFIHTWKPSIVIQNTTLTAFRNTQNPSFQPHFIFPYITTTHTWTDPSIMIGVCCSAGISPNSLRRAAEYRTYRTVSRLPVQVVLSVSIWTASQVRGTHSGQSAVERHKSMLFGLAAVMVWKWQCIWCAPSTSFGMIIYAVKQTLSPSGCHTVLGWIFCRHLRQSSPWVTGVFKVVYMWSW